MLALGVDKVFPHVLIVFERENRSRWCTARIDLSVLGLVFGGADVTAGKVWKGV